MKPVIQPANGICHARGYLNAHGNDSFDSISRMVTPIIRPQSTTQRFNVNDAGRVIGIDA